MIKFFINIYRKIRNNKIDVEELSTIKNVNIIYYNIIRVLCQNNYLTEDEIIFLQELNKDQLIEIIKTYNDLYNISKKKNYNIEKNYQIFESLLKLYDDDKKNISYRRSFTSKY
jgi:hypothetical protein